MGADEVFTARSTSGSYDREPEIRELHEAIGRYLTGFSEIVSAMRYGVHDYIEPPGLDYLDPGRGLLDILMANMTAQPLATAFFAMTAAVGRLDNEDEAIKNWLRNRVRDHMEFRNDLAHAEWRLGWKVDATDEKIPPISLRIKSRDGIPTVQDVGIQASDIHARIRQTQFLTRKVTMLARVARARQHGDSVRLGTSMHLVKVNGDTRLEDIPPPDEST